MADMYAGRCRGLTGGLIVLGLGCLFLLRNLHVIPGLEVYWPVILIIVGVAMIVGALFRGQKPSEPQ